MLSAQENQRRLVALIATIEPGPRLIDGTVLKEIVERLMAGGFIPGPEPGAGTWGEPGSTWGTGTWSP